jgi:hypothetical protein
MRVSFSKLIAEVSAPLENCSLLTRDQQNTVTAWLPATSKSSKWKLAWRGSRDGFGAANFHSLCDLKGDNIVVIKSTTGHLFGGYCSTSWDANKGNLFGVGEEAPDSFLFTLTNPNGIPPTKYLPKEGENAIFQGGAIRQVGPAFGKDVWVVDNCNKVADNIEFPSSFLDTTGKGKNTFTGSGKFTVSDIEVFIH